MDVLFTILFIMGIPAALATFFSPIKENDFQ